MPPGAARLPLCRFAEARRGLLLANPGKMLQLRHATLPAMRHRATATWRSCAALRHASTSNTPARAAATVELDASAASASAASTASAAGSGSALVSDARGLLKCYAQLSKARLSLLVVMSGSAGFLLAGAPVALDTLAAVTLGTAMQASAANTFNQLYEIRTDALMQRTCLRPLPSGRISPAHAAAFGITNAVGGAAVLAALCNPLTAALGTANLLLYACVYTPLKQRSEWNTWVGAIVGGIPPLMGYAAATGTVFSAEAGVLSAALFLWQFPHFFSLAWLSRKDYAAGGHQMIPCADLSGAATAGLLTRYSLALSALPPLSYSLGITSAMFPLESMLFSGYLVYGAYKFKETPSMGNARRVFRTSLWYLPVFMAAMIFHKNDWTDPEGRGAVGFSPARSSSNGGSGTGTGSGSSGAEAGEKRCPVSLPAALQQATASPARPALSDLDVAAAARGAGGSAFTLEGAMRCAKEQMRQLCVHEVMAPPLTRVGARPFSSSSSSSSSFFSDAFAGGDADGSRDGADLGGAATAGAAPDAVPMCPVSQATHLVTGRARKEVA